jgi:CO/xanthine dehydrogenase Mo-binding subunit
MTFFRDVQRYDGMDVPFYKRAQLTAADLSLALARRGLGAFGDLDRLTIFADNLVPHVLRVDGVLSYDAGLAARIDREELIAAGSAEEVEIRACALHAVELTREALGRDGRAVTAMGLDYVLWNRGQERHYKTIKPRHRARTVYY